MDGQARTLIGVNASGAASTVALGSPCGGTDVDLDQMFSVLPERALVRVWFTQRMASRAEPFGRIWDALDAVVAAAERAPNRPLLLITLATGSGDCDGNAWRNRDWYDGGYAAGPEPGLPNSYLGWVEEVVSRYGPSPAIGIWEPVNEPDPSTCSAPGSCWGKTRCDPGAGQSLASFLDRVGARIHEIDADGLVSTGGGGWCGWQEESDKIAINGAPNVDVLSLHDYNREHEPVPGWVKEMDRVAKLVNKPFITGEVGISAGGQSGRTIEERAELFRAKIDGQFDQGASAVLLWVYGYGPGECELCVGPADPALTVLASTSTAAR